ncbi:uncharacterized protein MAM_01139 [Metarhizium album ARSEF 1941]|uniref:Uncharacterized protein n=1 Tax=Metarhizium album (strain ARSEF 1941) TaxID=1081103 RepID=A0A0B2X8P0_METAS|nr:uncharacterized protein MAM_01139 [Metarhizium album ARSEF 1941]KHO02138.1 hypothetical protein MAM_01139 [Metarhizium album ARSEF 1941]
MYTLLVPNFYCFKKRPLGVVVAPFVGMLFMLAVRLMNSRKGGTRKIKTIHHASVLYERATEDRTRYQGRTRADFDTLHQSVHEFRVVDRSDAHTREIRGAERPSAQATWPVQGHEHEHEHEHELDTNTLLNQLFAEVSNNLDEQGAWSQWWPAIDQVDL